MMKNLVRGLVASAALLAGQSALGATFDFSIGATGGSVPATGYETTSDGITVNVSTPEGDMLDYYTFHPAGYGIGHSGCVAAPFIGDICSAAIQYHESLVITFSEAVTVTGMTLAAWDKPDKALITGDNGSEMTLKGSWSNQLRTFDLSDLGEITSFTLENIKYTGLFTLRSLEVQPVAPVPLPAAAWLFMSAFGGLVGARRLRRRQ